MKSNYSQDLSIDKFQLEEEWLNQPALFCKYSNEYAEAVLERDQLKQRLEIIRAQLDSDIRKNPELFEVSKITEASVANRILLSPEYQLAHENLIEATRNMNILSGAKEAFSQRKTALEHLSRLFLNNYYSDLGNPPDRLKGISEEQATEMRRQELNQEGIHRVKSILEGDD